MISTQAAINEPLALSHLRWSPTFRKPVRELAEDGGCFVVEVLHYFASCWPNDHFRFGLKLHIAIAFSADRPTVFSQPIVADLCGLPALRTFPSSDLHHFPPLHVRDRAACNRREAGMPVCLLATRKAPSSESVIGRPCHLLLAIEAQAHCLERGNNLRQRFGGRRLDHRLQSDVCFSRFALIRFRKSSGKR